MLIRKELKGLFSLVEFEDIKAVYNEKKFKKTQKETLKNHRHILA